MFSRSSLAALCATIVTVTAQSSTPASITAHPTGPVVSLLLPGGWDSQALVASVIGVDKSATTLAVDCPDGTDSNDCGVPPEGLTVTQGPTTAVMSTVIAQESDPVIVKYGWECSLGGTTTAKCVYLNEATITGSANAELSSSMLENYGGSGMTTTIGLNSTEMKDAFVPVTVTAGAEKLSQKTEATGAEASAPSSTPGAAAHVKAGGLAVGGMLAAVLML
ncbi:hypothetical protein N0V90_006339 [Kalmusia sp. IMI 367209]|nr:hypothetical protein N0V90_006339 [Kalmusia sp. IMI 367209]